MQYGATAFISPGSGELILIMLALILLFGAKDAPRILRSIQSILDKIQRTAADFRYQIMYGDLGSTGGHIHSPDEEEPHLEPEEDAEWVDVDEDDVSGVVRRSDAHGDAEESDSAGFKADSDTGTTGERGAQG